MLVLVAATSLLDSLTRLGYKAITARAETRHAEVIQQGLAEQVRFLPPVSRLRERTTDREIEIVLGHPAGTHGERRW
ncbi:hypothetical protein [Streptomyces sp. NPDC093071]|uniref:hypothetical protein n=1 Tax=Streptomyces sp. NPDC093071 TaxID=3366022 RepID=UPI0038114DA4